MQPKKTHLNHQTLRLLKNWTWQFVVIRPICSVLMIALQVIGIYPSWLSWTFTIILNLSFSLAMYSLVIFYHVFAKELEPHKPLSKFICIKGIVFFCFWQVTPTSPSLCMCMPKLYSFNYNITFYFPALYIWAFMHSNHVKLSFLCTYRYVHDWDNYKYSRWNVVLGYKAWGSGLNELKKCTPFCCLTATS